MPLEVGILTPSYRRGQVRPCQIKEPAPMPPTFKWTLILRLGSSLLKSIHITLRKKMLKSRLSKE